MSFEIIAARSLEDNRGEESNKKTRRGFIACPTLEWYRFDARAKATLSGPHGNQSDEYKQVGLILSGMVQGYRWHQILCRDALDPDYSLQTVKKMTDEERRFEVFVARGGSTDDAECDFLTAVMVCEYLEEYVYVHFLCSGVPGVGGQLLEYAVSEIKKYEKMHFVALSAVPESKNFYLRHDFVVKGNKSKGPDALVPMRRRWRLDLSNKGLRRNQLPDFTTLPNLEYLDLKGNAIDEIPKEVFAMKKLKHLNLEDNYNFLREVPPGICDIQSLEYLSLGDGAFAMPDDIGRLVNLKTLRFIYAELKSLPPSIGDLQNLVTLDLHDNDLKVLPVELKKLKALRVLDFSGNAIVDFPVDILNELPSLRRVWCWENGGEGFRYDFDGEDMSPLRERMRRKLLKIKQIGYGRQDEFAWSARDDGTLEMTHAGTQAFAFLSKFGEMKISAKSGQTTEALLGPRKSAFDDWFVSDDFERDMRAYATRLESLPLDAIERLGLEKLRENGFAPPLAAA